jgi:hypothetical protein
MEIANSPFLHYAIKIRTELKIEIKDFASNILATFSGSLKWPFYTGLTVYRIKTVM